MKVGIIGHGQDKFTEFTEAHAKHAISSLLENYRDQTIGANDEIVVVSGHSPVGGIDIWAEDIAATLGLGVDIKTPRQNRWEAEYGFKARNLDIARSSDVVYVIVVTEYPPNYEGRKFSWCYHCPGNSDHVKSGACWTARRAIEMGKPAYWILI
jgi:hypothetical protein